MKEYNRVFISNPFELLKLTGQAFSRLSKTRNIDEENKISKAFSERINLVISGVNNCPYCIHLHKKQGLEAGLDKEDMKAIIDGDLSNIPDEEKLAVQYAKEWAENKREMPDERISEFVDKYGEEKAMYIYSIMYMVYLGNMCSNIVIAYKSGKTGKYNLGFFVTYMLATPVANMIKNKGNYPD